VSDPATANKVYDNDIFFKNGPADYSSPVLHTVWRFLLPLLCCLHRVILMPLHRHLEGRHWLRAARP